MATETDTRRTRDPRRLFLAIFAVLCVLLAAGYYAFLRGDYTVLYSQLKPADAAAIVATLDAKGISHKLRDGGTTILVPTDEADSGQLAVAGSDVPLKGSVGFELFNKSDMGLTDFAQKINYQRALQGELARTIMMMDGIENARVHLALPEHSLFRSRQSTPRAAIEVIARDGQTLGTDRIAGIQQLVASAVPDLPVDEVVVLDGDGRIASTTRPADDGAAAVDTEQAAVQAYYSARAKTALANALPGVEFDVHALVLSTSTASSDDAAAPASTAAAPATDTHTGARNFQLRMTVVTQVPLNAEDEQAARKAVADAIALDETHGDSLSFEVGVPSATTTPVQTAASTMPASTPSAVPPAAPMPSAPVISTWLWIVLAAIGAAAAAWLVLRDRANLLDPAEREAFVARLRQQLAQGDARG